MRSETSIIHLNLVSALAVAQIIFLTGIEATQNKVFLLVCGYFYYCTHISLKSGKLVVLFV